MVLVTVLMPIYNGEKYLKESIDSILKQTFDDFEFLIINDGSTDQTREIILDYQDPRIKLLDNPTNLGIVESLNRGLALANGQFVARQDADDISKLYRLQRQIEILEQDLDCALVSCNLEIIDSTSRLCGIWKRACDTELLPWYLLFDNWLAGHSQVMFRRDVVLALNGYSDQYIHAEDYDLWLRIAESGKKILILSEPLMQYRVHGKSISKQKENQQLYSSLSISRNSIEKCISKGISLEQMKVIRGFWIGQWWHYDFPPASKAKFISQQMKELKQSYLLQLDPQSDQLRQKLDKLIHLAIGRQFAAWLQSPLTSRHSLLSKLKISKYAFTWYPQAALQAWMIWMIRLPIDSINSVLNKIKYLWSQVLMKQVSEG